MTTVTAHTYTQHDRELLVAAWLDIDSSRFRAAVLGHAGHDTAVDFDRVWNASPLLPYIVQILDDNPDGQLMAQAIALTSDAELRAGVAAFGTDPLIPTDD